MLYCRHACDEGVCVCYTFNSRKILTILISRRSDVGFLSLLYTFFCWGGGSIFCNECVLQSKDSKCYVLQRWVRTAGSGLSHLWNEVVYISEFLSEIKGLVLLPGP